MKPADKAKAQKVSETLMMSKYDIMCLNWTGCSRKVNECRLASSEKECTSGTTHDQRERRRLKKGRPSARSVKQGRIGQDSKACLERRKDISEAVEQDFKISWRRRDEGIMAMHSEHAGRQQH